MLKLQMLRPYPSELWGLGGQGWVLSFIRHWEACAPMDCRGRGGHSPWGLSFPEEEGGREEGRLELRRRCVWESEEEFFGWGVATGDTLHVLEET